MFKNQAMHCLLKQTQVKIHRNVENNRVGPYERKDTNKLWIFYKQKHNSLKR
jgi:hypothetical protein